MPNLRTKAASPKYNVESRIVDFNLVDHKKRGMGTKITIWEEDFIEAPSNATFWDTISVGHKFAFYGQAVRNGKDYGPGTPAQYFPSIFERGMAINKYENGAIRRAAKVGTPAPAKP